MLWTRTVEKVLPTPKEENMSPIEVFRFAFVGALGVALGFVVMAVILVILRKILEE